MKSKIVITVLLLVASMFANADIGNTATQQTCLQTGTKAPNNNTTWANGGLNRALDRQVYKRDIIAYKIKWSSGWSGWYVKGVNDLYSLTTPNGAMSTNVDARLVWIYFYDHEHMYISCS